MHANIDTLFRSMDWLSVELQKAREKIYNQIGLKVCDTIHITKYTYTERECMRVYEIVYMREIGK